MRLKVVTSFLVGMLVFLAVATVPSASAGTYTVYSCLRPVELADPAWAAFESSQQLPPEWEERMVAVPADGIAAIGQQGAGPLQSDSFTINSCGDVPIVNGVGKPGTLEATVKKGSTTTPHTTETGFEYRGPPGTSIVGYRIGREFTLRAASTSVYVGSYYRLALLKGMSETPVEGRCAGWAGVVLIPLGCGGAPVSFTSGRGTVAESGIPAGKFDAIRAISGCIVHLSFEGGCSSVDGSIAVTALRHLQVQLHDPNPPAALNVSGSLVERMQGPMNGQATLEFSAEDLESGVYRATIEFDNQPVVRQVVDQNGGSCRDAGANPSNDYEFDSQKPCKQTAAGRLDLDIDKLYEGTHTLRAYVEDASGNRTDLIPLTEVVIQRGASVASRSCEPCNGTTGDPRSGRLVVGEPRDKLRLQSGKKLHLDGAVVDAAGQPVAGADVDVLQRIHLPRRSFTRVATVQTDGSGKFNYAPATTSSRTVRFAFAPRRGSDLYSSTIDTDLIVGGKVSLSARKRVIKPYGVLKLRGRVEASPLDRGVPLQIQARDGRRWRTIDITHTDRGGRFEYRYRFKRVPSGVFRFRASAIDNSDLPIEPTSSRAVTVRVGKPARSR